MSAAGRDGRVDYIEFHASDIDRTKQFFGEVFGWKFEDYGPDYTSFQDGRLSGGFSRGVAQGGGGTLIVLYAAALEKMEQKVRAAGGVIVKEIFSFPGGRRFHFSDPSGNELAVWSDH